MTVFALIHGGGHGAWCWEPLMESLKGLGHRGIAMDLPTDDPDAGAEAWASVAARALADVAEPVVIVGHSLGGLVVPVLATMRPTEAMIFLASGLPVPGMSHEEQKVIEPDMIPPFVGANRGFNKERLYNKCTPQVADWAEQQLRIQTRRLYEEVTPLRVWPAIPMAYVVGTDDRAVSPTWGRRAAKERYGLTAYELVGADHSPMLSRPDELAELLVRIVDDLGAGSPRRRADRTTALESVNQSETGHEVSDG